MSDKYVTVELFALSYGSLVRAIVKDTNNIEDANAKLAKIGVSIGNRIADDILVSDISKGRFSKMKDVGDMLVEAFKNYLGVTAKLLDTSDTKIVIRLLDNPVTKYVTIPLEYDGLVYLTPLLSAIKTMLQMFHYSTEVKLVSDRLKKQPYNDIEVKLIEVLRDSLPAGEYIN